MCPLKPAGNGNTDGEEAPGSNAGLDSGTSRHSHGHVSLQSMEGQALGPDMPPPHGRGLALTSQGSRPD